MASNEETVLKMKNDDDYMSARSEMLRLKVEFEDMRKKHKINKLKNGRSCIISHLQLNAAYVKYEKALKHMQSLCKHTDFRRSEVTGRSYSCCKCGKKYSMGYA